MLTYQQESSVLRFVRADLIAAKLSLTLPVFSGEGAVRASKSVARTVKEVTSAIEHLCDRVLAEYTASTDPHRRFRHRPYEITLAYRESACLEEYLSFVVRLCVRRGGEGERVYALGETIRRRDGVSLPLFCFADRRARRALGGWEYFLDEEGKVCVPS